MISWMGVDGLAQPEALLLLLLMPLYLLWYRRYYRRQRLVVRLSYDPEKLQKPRFNVAWLRMLPRVLQGVGIMLLIIALARPQTSQRLTEQQDLGSDVIIVLDVSRSMNQKDVLPSRLSSARTAIRSLINSRPGDRFGLVLAGPAALSSVPLTFDHEFVLTMLERSSANSLPGEGTALGPALGVGLNRLRESDAPSKVMVIFSDGGANGGSLDPLSASRLAAESGVILHAVGVAGKPSGDQEDYELLQQISDQTGGEFLAITNRQQSQNLGDRLLFAEDDRSQARVFTVWEDLYPEVLKLAILILAAAFLLMLTSVYNPLEQ